MPNMTGSGATICPFYRCEMQSKISCEGLTETQVSVIMTFVDRKKKLEWQQKYCMLYSYGNCPLAAAIYRNYAD